jgi:hypothetical protein
MATPVQTSQSPPVPEAATEGQKSSFELAAERARARFPDEVWALLDRGQRSNAIYAELRLIDSEAARTKPKCG